MIPINNVDWPSEEVVERFITVTNGTCCIALDHVLNSIRSKHTYGHKAAYLSYLSEKMQTAVRETRKCTR